MNKIVNFTGSIVALAGMMTLRAYVVTVLWAWFAVVMFGVPQITVVGTVGVILMINLILSTRGIPKSDPETSMGERFGTSVGISLGGLLIGWIVKLWM